MKRTLIAFSILVISGCGSNERQWAPEVQDNLKYAVIFRIVPDSDGNISEFSVARVLDIGTEEEVDFRPSEAFVSEARGIFGKERWAVTYDEDGRIEPRFMFCYYSTAVPDHPIVSEEFLN